jgi:hypothetical protein
MGEDWSDDELEICVLQYWKACKNGGQNHEIDRSAFIKGALRGSEGEGRGVSPAANVQSFSDYGNAWQTLCDWVEALAECRGKHDPQN